MSMLNSAQRQDGDGDVVDNRRHGGPQRQSPDSLGIDGHHDGIARTHLDRLTTSEPTLASARDHVAIRAHHVDALAIRFLCNAPALGDIVVPGEAGVVYMRRGALDFSHDGDLLRSEEHTSEL